MCHAHACSSTPTSLPQQLHIVVYVACQSRHNARRRFHVGRRFSCMCSRNFSLSRRFSCMCSVGSKPALHMQPNRRTTPDGRRYGVGKAKCCGCMCSIGRRPKKLTTTSRGCNHDESAQIQKSNLCRLFSDDGFVCFVPVGRLAHNADATKPSGYQAANHNSPSAENSK